jgi:hypothetical protein
MLDKPFDQMDKTYIESLIADRVVEVKHLDYKETLPGDTDKEKNRLVEDICSFANAAGGDIFFGLRDKRDERDQKTGTPEYVGLKGLNLDREKLRLEHIILNKVEPRIGAVQFRLVEGFADGPVLIMRIPKSYNAPHMTKHDGRFHSRTDSGNYAMDVQEIRSAFIASETLPERMRQFRAERLAKIVAGETPVALNNGSKMILHVVPLSVFSRKDVCDLSEVDAPPIDPVPMGASGWDHRYNFDGLLAYCAGRAYTQLFRDGRIEAVEAGVIQRGSDRKAISCAFEEIVVSSLENSLQVQKKLGVAPPLVVMLTLIGVCGYRIVGWGGFDEPDSGPIDRDDLLSDEHIIEESDCDCARMMKPIFDAIWNAAGLSRSMNYDENGNWTRHT